MKKQTVNDELWTWAENRLEKQAAVASPMPEHLLARIARRIFSLRGRRSMKATRFK